MPKNFQVTPVVSVEDIRKEKAFVSMLKKQQKETDQMKKRHFKERAEIQKQQQKSVEKLMAVKGSKKEHNSARWVPLLGYQIGISRVLKLLVRY